MAQADLARAASVSCPTIARLEADDGVLDGGSDTAEKVAGVIFVDENGDGPGVRLRKAGAGVFTKPTGPATVEAITKNREVKPKR